MYSLPHAFVVLTLQDIINVTSHHTIPEEEKRRFVEYVNSVLRDDPDVKHLVPVDPTSMAFFEAAKDGILLMCDQLGFYSHSLDAAS